MIIMYIAGGMGNQMFKYAAGLTLASRLNTELFLDTLFSRTYAEEDRPYRLSCFPAITEPEASFSTIGKLSTRLAVMKFILNKPVRMWHVFRRLIRKIDSKFPNDAMFKPHYKCYAPEFDDIPDNSYIEGYFESERCFAGCEDLVRKKFTFSPECFDPALLSEVQSCESAVVHVRRGDKSEGNKSFYCTSEAYLRAAIERLTSLTSSVRFFVFSDDIDWCRRTLPGIYETDYTFIDGRTPAQDMALMTKCRHVIVGPSTFSWWGAWLNDNPNKIIIAPDINLWYKHLSRSKIADRTLNRIDDRKYLLPSEWIKIS